MTTVYVEFSDSDQKTMVSVFGCPQDAAAYPNQGEIDSSDARYQAFINPAPSYAQLWANYQSQAQAALTESDKTIMRCYESAVAVPLAWATYRKALRAIVSAASGDSTQPLPAKPAYPAGT